MVNSNIKNDENKGCKENGIDSDNDSHSVNENENENYDRGKFT
jgi:hypothetical protein